MTFQDDFEGVICMDAMENIPPEDWPLVLNNFHRALKRQGILYFTVETIENADENELRQAFEKAQAAGLPIVYGEWPDEGVYHYHPTNQQVREWVQQAGFEILKEANGEMWYYHILMRKGLDQE
jgi:cyclopropane fatty-acyl-phospholipid synthase-like methyltransferase